MADYRRSWTLPSKRDIIKFVMCHTRKWHAGLKITNEIKITVT